MKLMINERYELPVKLGLTLLWAGAVIGAYYLSEHFGEPLVVRFYAFMLLDPLLLLAGCSAVNFFSTDSLLRVCLLLNRITRLR